MSISVQLLGNTLRFWNNTQSTVRVTLKIARIHSVRFESLDDRRFSMPSDFRMRNSGDVAREGDVVALVDSYVAAGEFGNNFGGDWKHPTKCTENFRNRFQRETVKQYTAILSCLCEYGVAASATFGSGVAWEDRLPPTPKFWLHHWHSV